MVNQLSIFEAYAPRARATDSFVLGAVYGRLTLTGTTKGHDGRTRWNAKCACGAEGLYRPSSLRLKHTVSCGCFGLESRVAKLTKHGHGTKSKTPTYQTWQHMIARCHCSTSDSYSFYGAKGIYVCQEWRNSFTKFLKDMGERPKERTLDRIDGKKGYFLENCRWSTVLQQAQNTSRAKLNMEKADLIRSLKDSGLRQNNLGFHTPGFWIFGVLERG